MRIPLPFRRMAFVVPLALSALTSWSQTVTDPSAKPGYDASKAQLAARAALSTPRPNATQQRSSAGVKAASGNAGSLAAAASSCFIPLDNTYTDVPTNDDGSFGPIALPFTFDLYGTQYTQVWINTNGNLTFTGPYGVFTSTGFPSSEPMVAGFWADEDTRSGGIIHYKVNPTNLIVTWDNVGYFAQHTDKVNTFQIIIASATDALLGPGQNVSLRYGDMQWTTGDASNGSGGFGGTPATVGVNNGNGTDYVQVGRFDAPGTAYDGPGGNNDGVDYLDNRCIGFNVSTAGNIPPSASNLPANNTVTVACGQTVTLNPQFLAPEVNQTVSVAVNTNGLCSTTASTTSGVTGSATIAITGAACNVGTHPIVLTATDNGSPTGVTTVTINVVVTPCVAPCNPNANTPVAGTDNFTASCGPITVTAAQLLANDTSPNGTPLAIGSVGGGGNGTV
ncbi:nidogen-like domain-containing protein, partial [Hymenobacter daeguensis]